MTHLDIIKKLIGNIHPAGDASRDDERLENLKTMCNLVENLIEEIQFVTRDKDAYESSVVKARDYASNFLTATLGITE